MLRKIYKELSAIRKELQAIRNDLEHKKDVKIVQEGNMKKFLDEVAKKIC